jgi:hypothetical protein
MIAMFSTRLHDAMIHALNVEGKLKDLKLVSFSVVGLGHYGNGTEVYCKKIPPHRRGGFKWEKKKLNYSFEITKLNVALANFVTKRPELETHR